MKRKAEIIKLIWNETKPISVETIAHSIHVSPKTIRNELDDLEHLLADYQIRLVKKPGQGITLEGSAEAKQKLSAYFQSWDEQKMLTPIDRQRNLLAKLFAENRPLLIKSLSLDYYVSRSTITKDITELNKRLSSFNLRIDYLKGEGITIVGEEADQRKAMAKLVPLYDQGSQILYVEDDTVGSSAFLQRFKEALQVDYQRVERIVNDAESQLGFRFSTEAKVNLIIHLAIAIKRTLQGSPITLTEELTQTLDGQREITIAEHTAHRIEIEFGVRLPKAETYYILLHFMGAKRLQEGLDVLSFKLSSDTPDLERIILELIRRVQSDLNLFLESDAQLFNSLLLHLKPTLNRLKYGLSLDNPLYQQIQNSYPGLCETLGVHSDLFKVHFGIDMPSHEIAYLALHFAAAQERNTKPIRALVMCASGLGTAQLIVAKLRRAFTNLNIVDVVSSLDASRYSEADIDLIISTIPVSSPIKTVVINALMTTTDLQHVKAVLDEDLSPRFTINLAPDHVHLRIDLESKTEVLRYLAKHLVETGSVTTAYLEGLEEREALGPTVIAPYIAIPHARFDTVLRSSIQLVTLKKPVIWDGVNPVQLILNVAATKAEASRYIPLFTRLADLTEERKRWDELLALTDPEDVCTHFNRLMRGPQELPR
jgi:activator of the mannose operon, transcriptional antiterminator